jgi:hypothetical protein
MEESRKRLAQPDPPRSQAEGRRASDVIDGVSTGMDVIDLIGDGLSLMGKLLD